MAHASIAFINIGCVQHVLSIQVHDLLVSETSDVRLLRNGNDMAFSHISLVHIVS